MLARKKKVRKARCEKMRGRKRINFSGRIEMLGTTREKFQLPESEYGPIVGISFEISEFLKWIYSGYPVLINGNIELRHSF